MTSQHPTPAPSALPTMFLLAAEAALTAGGRDYGVAERLNRAAAFVMATLTIDNLLRRNRDLFGVALEYGAWPRADHGHSRHEFLKDGS